MNTVLKGLAASTALAVVLPSVASADVSAIEVWDNWKTYAERFGQTVTVGSQSVSGDTLKLEDVVFSMEFPEGSMSATMASLEFKERGEGTVAITMAPSMPILLNARPEGEPPVDLVMTVHQKGTSIIASGDASTLTYDYLASEIGVSLDEVKTGDTVVDAGVNVTLGDIDGRYVYGVGETNTLQSAMTAGSMIIDVSINSPDTDGTFVVRGTASNLQSHSNVSFPADFDPENEASFLDGTLNVAGGMSLGGVEYQANFQEGSDQFSANVSSESSGIEFALADGTLQYGGSTTGASYAFSGSEIPFPEISFSLGEAGFNLQFPLAKSDEAKDLGILLKLVDFQISDMIWGMLDPTGAFPRDPATLIIDLVGRGRLAMDLTDPAVAESLDGVVPFEPESVAINAITLNAVGASLDGSGAFTFDNTDLETFDGMPAPTGSINLQIKGINGLLDKLIAMGLVPQDQAMGARMMIGLFARPAGGEDEWVSSLEVRSDGSIFANGQQLQ